MLSCSQRAAKSVIRNNMVKVSFYNEHLNQAENICCIHVILSKKETGTNLNQDIVLQTWFAFMFFYNGKWVFSNWVSLVLNDKLTVS